MPETTVWDGFLLECPECDGLLEPQVEGHRDESSGAVACYNCEVEFDLRPIPRGRQTTGLGICPECGGDLKSTDDWGLSCQDCPRIWKIEEVSWLRPATG